MDRDQKIYTRILLVTIINSLELDDIHRIIANDTKKKHFQQTMVDQVLKRFPELDVKKVKEFIDSIIGNVVKAYDDLRLNKPEGIDVAKLQLWRQVWIKEKEKSERADDIDSRYLLSKKMRLVHASHAETSSSDCPLPREDALVKTEYNSKCTFTIGIPKEAISITCKLGSGAYGTVSKCQIKGISFLPESIPWCCKEFKGGVRSQLKNFASESSIDLLHPGIVRPIAHTRTRPWRIIFPYYNGDSLASLLEIVPYPAHFAKMVGIQDNKGKDRPPKVTKKVSDVERERGHNLCLHAPSLIHALVQAMAHAHSEGILHNDLHPWNMMLDFTAGGVPRIGIIDWGLAMRAGVEHRPTNITNPLEHKIRPWRADELLDAQSPCPWTYGTDVYAVAWVIYCICKFCFEYSAWAKTDWANTRTSIDVKTIERIVEESFLKKNPEERGTMADFDGFLQRMELQPL